MVDGTRQVWWIVHLLLAAAEGLHNRVGLRMMPQFDLVARPSGGYLGAVVDGLQRLGFKMCPAGGTTTHAAMPQTDESWSVSLVPAPPG